MSLDLWPRLPHDASADGHRIAELLRVAHGLTGATLAAALAALLAALVRGWLARDRAQAAEPAESRRQLWTAFGIAALALGAIDQQLAARSLEDVNRVFWNFELPESDPATVRVEINAHQWAWDIRYAGQDGLFQTADDIVTWNELKVPIGRKVLLQLASTDVIHSFYLPNFMVKMDAVPGRVNKLWFQAREAGQFEIACSQHCGVAHYKMRGRLEVMSEADFTAWAQLASESARSAYDPADEGAHWGWAWH